MKQLLVRQIDDTIIRKLKLRAAENGVSAEEQHRRILAEALNGPAQVKEPLATYLVKHPVCPKLDLPLDRSSRREERGNMG
ncbi:MAG: DNA-binding protein [Kiritimatiellae bacterium]|nr:DNA-binding protein [Kiritimatiellia bacterium]